MLTICPRPRGRMCFSAAIAPKTTPRYVTSVTRRNSSGAISLTVEKTVTIASLTHKSIGPSSPANRSAAPNTASSRSRR